MSSAHTSFKTTPTNTTPANTAIAALSVSGLSYSLNHVSNPRKSDPQKNNPQNSRPLLNDLSFELAAGRWMSIVGPNGAGKSSLLKALAGVIDVTGEIKILGQDRAQYSRKILAQTLSYLEQSGSAPSLGDEILVADVVLLGRLPHQNWRATPSLADHLALERALRRTGAWEWRHRTLQELSGGERQRVLLARLLAVEAQVLLMDEPLLNLDPPHQADWVALVKELLSEGKTVISVLHDMTLALMADDMLILREGCMQHFGATSDAATGQALESVFEQRVQIHTVDNQRIALMR